MGKAKELSIQKRLMEIDHQKSDNGFKEIYKRLNITSVSIDGEGGNKEPKHHGLRIADIGCIGISGSPSITKNNKTLQNVHT